MAHFWSPELAKALGGRHPLREGTSDTGSSSGPPWESPGPRPVAVTGYCLQRQTQWG